MKIINKIISIIMIAAIAAGALAFSSSAAVSVKGSEVAAFAVNYEGCEYKYAAKGPDAFDCSGFVYFVLENFGIEFGNSTSEYNSQAEAEAFGEVIADIEQAKAGDIVVWENHAAVYLGDGECIAAMNPKKGVRINTVEKFVDQDNVVNPPHFFIRPDEYIDETQEEQTETAPEEPVTQPQPEETKKDWKTRAAERYENFISQIEEMLLTIKTFLTAPFKPVVNLFK